MKIFLFLALLGGCAQTTVQSPFQNNVEFLAPDSAKKPLKVSKREFWQIHGAEDILRKTPAATLSIWFRQSGHPSKEQDVISISIGSQKSVPLNVSRAAIRVFPDGRLLGIARAGDREATQNILTKPVIKHNKWHHVALVIDYANDEMRFYLDGKELPTKGAVDFKSPETADTASTSVVLGAEDNGFTNHFEGVIKDVGVWRKELNDEELMTLAKKLKPGEKIMIGL